MTEEMKHIPAVALRGMTILPAMIVHFDISREMSIKAVEQAMLSDQKLFVVTQKDPRYQNLCWMICIGSVRLWRLSR